MKKALIVILALLIIGGGVLLVISKSNQVKNSNQTDQNNQTGQNFQVTDSGQTAEPPRTGEGSAGARNQNGSNPSAENQSQPGKVAGLEITKSQVGSQTDSTQTKTTAPVTKPKSVSAPTTKIMRVSGLGFEVSVPLNTGARIEITNDDEVIMYDSKTLNPFAIMAVRPDVNQTLNSVLAELQGNPQNTNIQRMAVNGIPALSYHNPQYGTVIALVRGNNVYFLEGQLATPQMYRTLKFF